MCDYSLEMYHSRPALVGETYQTQRFPSGTIGFVAPENPNVAICMAYDTRLKLENIPQAVQDACKVSASEPATFVRLDGGLFHDGVRFDNNAEVTLQRLGAGVKVTVTDTLLGQRFAQRTAETV